VSAADGQAPPPPVAPPPVPPPAPQERPEVLAGAAFAGGLVTALLLRRLRGRR
jgi:hypothetical protein